MRNKLPEKLTYLRKYYQYAQGDIANTLNVPVTEYMNWENGNSICSIKQLKILADIYHVSLDDLADNTKNVVLPEDTLENSVEIPFMNGADINQTQVIDDDAGDGQKTMEMNPVSSSEDNGHTKVMSAIQEVEESQEESSTVEPKKKKKPVDTNKRKIQSGIIVGVVALVVVIVIALIYLLNGGGTNITVSTLNRLALGDTYSLYVEQSGNVKIRGDFDESSSFSNAVQVSAYKDHAVILQSNGKIVSTSENTIDTSDWRDVKAVAAGQNHIVALTNEGKVLCAGSETACTVSNWSNIASVYAGDELTVALSNDGVISASGDDASVVNGQSNVKHVSISDSQITITKKDGTVTNYPIASGTVLDTSSWTNIESTASGTTLIAGLSKDGTVSIACDDEEIVKTVESWTNINYIAAEGSTIIAYDAKGKMYGAGDNSYNQYVNEGSDETEDEEDEITKLEEPTNIQVSETTANIVIKWNTVDHADYYEVTMNTNPETNITSSSNSTSIPTTSLADGETYTITVTAKNDDEEKYESSSASISYTYTAKTVQLNTPDGITAYAGNGTWTVSWSSVEHADYYMISLDGNEEIRADSNSYTYSLSSTIITEGLHNVAIRAVSVNSTYTDSEAGRAEVQYTAPTFNVTITYVDGETVVGTEVVQALAGTYTVGELAQNSLVNLDGNYTLVNGGTSVTINSDYGLTVNVTQSE